MIDEKGAAALSMRALARELGSGTATLYRHFDGKTMVVAHVVDRVLGEVEFSASELGVLGWRQAGTSVAMAMFEALRRHPNVAPLLVESAPLGPNALALRERMIAVLLDNGFAPDLAARAYATLARYVLGFAIQLTSPDGDARLAGVFHDLDPQLFPATATVADHAPVPLEDEFTFGLELIVEGLAQLRRRTT